MAKINDIRMLAEVHAQEIARSPREWMGYLDTASRLYRYPFRDALLIHAQKPGATACAELEVWNNKMLRWVNRGSKGIALLDNTGPREHLRYVFDVSDTHPVKGSRELFLWQMGEEYREETLNHLADTYNLDDVSAEYFPAALRVVARMQVEENLEESLYGLTDETAGSFLEGLDEDTVRVEYGRLLTDSVFYTLLKRCSYDPEEFLSEENFSGIVDYNNLTVLSYLGNAVSSLSEPVLRDIGRTVRKIYQENLKEQLAFSTNSMYNLNSQLDTRSHERENARTQEIGGMDYGTDVSSQRGLPVSEPRSERSGAGEHRQVRNAAQDVPEGEPSELLSEPVVFRETEQTSGGDRPDGNREDGTAGSAAAPEVPGTGQRDRPDGMGSAHEQSDSDGGRDGAERAGVQLTDGEQSQDTAQQEPESGQEKQAITQEPIIDLGEAHEPERLELQLTDETTEQDLSEAEEETASALSLPELPTANQQILMIEERQAALYAGKIAIPSDVVDEFLRAGSNQSRGHLRIIYNNMIDQSPEEYTDFIKREYKNGGRGLVVDGKEYSAWWDELGMQIAVGHTVNDKVLSKAFLSWEDVSGRIRQLLAQGEYAPQVVLDAARGNALSEHAETLAYMESDLASGVAELVFEDVSIFDGGFPDKVERLSGLLAQPEFLSDLNERLAGLAEAYEEEPELMRFRLYNPVRVSEQFCKFEKETIPYQAREGFAWKEHGHFITQDEIDAFLTDGGPYSDGRLSTYSYYCMGHSDSEKAQFLKETYGEGGRGPALSGASDSHADYDAKGLRLERGTYGDPYAKVLLSWKKVAQRVDSLISQEKFLKPADYSRMPDFERRQMVNRVIGFYSKLPAEIPRPFTNDYFNEQARKDLDAILLDEQKTEDLLSEMTGVLATLPLDTDRYEERVQIMTELVGYAEGTYTVFPQREKEVEMVSGRQMTLFDFMSAEAAEPESAEEEAGVLEDDFTPLDTFETTPFEEPEKAAADRLQPLSSEAAEEYNAIKERYANSLVGFEQHGHYEFYGEDARLVSGILGSRLLEKPLLSGTVQVTGFPSGQWVYYSKRLWSKGENVYLAGEKEDGTHEKVKFLSGNEYLPLDALIHIDGREFRIDTVDYNRDVVSLQDMTMAREARYPIFREEPAAYVRALYEQEEPEFDFDTENLVAEAMESAGVSYEDFTGEQMDVIYDAALLRVNIEPMLNPDFSPAQMQLIADIAERTKAGERAAFEGIMAPLSGHVMTADEINAVRRNYRLPLDSFETQESDVVPEPEQGLEQDQETQGQEAEAEIGRETENGQESVSENNHETGPGGVKLRSIVLELNPSEEREPRGAGIRPAQGQTARENTGTRGSTGSVTQERINFHITDDDLGAGGPKAKFRANMDAIHLLKELESEGRLATAEEQETLSKFVGWGGIPQAFDAENTAWASEYSEVRNTLTSEEYREARGSTLNAFYTSPTVIKAIYSALETMGLRSGNVLEPSCGVGNFMGLVPDSMDGLNMYGVELDSITGRIAGQLYQKNRISVQGFETMQFPDSFFDCAIGNVPFGSYKVNDPKYDRYNFMIHDYFIARSIDLVRPGGVIAFVTSTGTMDKRDEAVRQYFANRADLLGAVRLPNDAFMRNANTGVVADILFFQKRDRAALEEPGWVHLAQTEEGYTLNSYFVEHPEMVLGTLTTESTQYGKQETTVKPIEGADLAEQLREAVSHIHGTITEVELDDSELDGIDLSIPADPGIRNFSYANVDGHVYYRENSRMNLVELPKVTAERVLGMIGLRNTVQELLSLQVADGSDAEIALLQMNLNRQYDAYTAQYGLINSVANRRAFSQDSSYCLLASLEILDEEGKLKRKADIFTKRTISRAVPVTSVDTASEALALSIGEKAKVDIPFMANLCGKREDEVKEELSGIIFQNPMTDEWETADEYLSGNVREKLKIARTFAENHPEYAVNVACLERVQPKDLDASEIEVRLGATWVKPEYIDQFMAEIFHTPSHFLDRGLIRTQYAQVSGVWNISGKSVNGGNPLVTSTYGTMRANGYRLLEDALNLRDTKIYDYVEGPDGKEQRVLNKKETTLAQQKQEMIREQFKDWIFSDMTRREDLCQTYNTLFNSIRPREYDGSHIRFVGMTPEISLMQHQKDAIAHILYGGNTLLAHCVGAGKTFQMVAAGMESKRLGLAQKCLYVVPNHLTEQWGSDFLRLYPGANILVSTKKDFEPSNRKKFCSRIATGDYDAIIIGHSQFEKIPLSRERQIASIQQQIDDITETIEEMGHEDGTHFTVKQMEHTRKSLQARLDRLNNQARKDDVVTFEQLGVDRLFVDESHSFKNLFLYTKMKNVAGISQTDAQKSSDMFMKCRYMDEITGSRGVTFATGTPVSNSMTELYTNMRYLQYDTLQNLGLGNFDAWAASFGETVTAIELAPEGTGYRSKTRFAKFYNLPELISLFKESADIQTADMLDLPVPEAEYINEVLQPSELQKKMVESFADRAEKVRGGHVDPRSDNMLKITNDGRKVALDERLMDPMLPDEPESKVNRCVENAFGIWKETAAQRSTQLIFCDLSTPKGDGTFNVYDDIRAKLVLKGIPVEEVAFIHEANTETRKAELFAKVRSGQVRILLGSTPKLGAGTNIQDRLIALHHLDCPWKPSDLEQQEGRILRQGNQNAKVKIFRYVTQNTFDSYMWQILENKQKFISQIMTSKSPVRSAEDVDDTALSYAEIKALATGNPHIKEKMDLDIQVSKLKLLKANHTSQIYRLESDIAKKYPLQITTVSERISGMRSDLQAAKPILALDKDHFEMVVGGKTYTDRKEAGTAIIAACAGLKAVNTGGQIGEYHGFRLEARLNFDTNGVGYILNIKRQSSYPIEVGKDPAGNITRIQNALGGIEKQLAASQQKLDDLQQQLAFAQEEVKKPFPQAEELEQKSKRLAELNAMLNIDERGSGDAIGLDEGDDVGAGQQAKTADRAEDAADMPRMPVSFAERVAAMEAEPVKNTVSRYAETSAGLHGDCAVESGADSHSHELCDADSPHRPSVLAKLHDKIVHNAAQPKNEKQRTESQKKKNEQSL